MLSSSALNGTTAGCIRSSVTAACRARWLDDDSAAAIVALGERLHFAGAFTSRNAASPGRHHHQRRPGVTRFVLRLHAFTVGTSISLRRLESSANDARSVSVARAKRSSLMESFSDAAGAGGSGSLDARNGMALCLPSRLFPPRPRIHQLRPPMATISDELEAALGVSPAELPFHSDRLRARPTTVSCGAAALGHARLHTPDPARDTVPASGQVAIPAGFIVAVNRCGVGGRSCADVRA